MTTRRWIFAVVASLLVILIATDEEREHSEPQIQVGRPLRKGGCARLRAQTPRIHDIGDPNRQAFVHGAERLFCAALFFWAVFAVIVFFCIVPFFWRFRAPDTAPESPWSQ
jgi:hypothetical protein